jgi:hypothetical protein
MKIIPESAIARYLLVIFLFAVIVVTGPTAIHFIYRSTTSLSDNKVQTEKYYYLTSVEDSGTPLSDPQRTRLETEKKRLVHWFHARGWNIDEGQKNGGLIHSWRELFRYWGSPKEMMPYPIAGE